MEQYERLWQYQQVDMELDQYEKEMRGNSNRKELLKHRDFLLEQQNVLKKIEADVEIMGDRMEALADEIERLNGSVAEASANFEAHRPEDLEEAKKQIAALQKLITTISRYESELAKMLKDEREAYETFWKNFGRQIKFGIYGDYGMHKDLLGDLLMFYSAKEKKLVTLDEYVEKMPEEQKCIYFAAGDDTDRLSKLPNAQLVLSKGYDLLHGRPGKAKAITIIVMLILSICVGTVGTATVIMVQSYNQQISEMNTFEQARIQKYGPTVEAYVQSMFMEQDIQTEIVKNLAVGMLFGALGAYPIVLGDRRKKQKQDTVQPYEAADGAPKSMENADDTDKHLDA